MKLLIYRNRTVKICFKLTYLIDIKYHDYYIYCIFFSKYYTHSIDKQ